MYCPAPNQAKANAISVVIADAFAIFREGLRAALSKNKKFKIIGEADNEKKLIDLVKKKHPDIAVVGTDMPNINGLEVTSAIAKDCPKTHVIIFSTAEDEKLIINTLRAGAKGFLMRDTKIADVLNAIEKVSANGTYYCTSTATRVADAALNNYLEKEKAVKLSEKEIEVIRLMCNQFSSKEIAATLKVSRRVVESTRERILEKTGAKNMVGIVVYAIRNGIFNLE